MTCSLVPRCGGRGRVGCDAAGRFQALNAACEVTCLTQTHVLAVRVGFNRFNNSKADSYRADRLLQSAWTALLGYVISRRTERYRWEHRHTALAVAHYRYPFL